MADRTVYGGVFEIRELESLERFAEPPFEAVSYG